MATPVPHDPGDVEEIIKRTSGAGPETRPPGSRGGTRSYLKILPPKVRAALCGDILAGRSWKLMHEEYGIDRGTYKRYRKLLSDYSDDLLTAKSEGRRRMIEDNIQWTLGVAKAGVQLARDAKEPILDKDGKPLRGENGEILCQEKPDTRAMSMFLKDAHDAIDRYGELHELTGKGADRRNARKMLREELESRKELQESQQKNGFGGGNGPLQVFVIPKLPGVEQRQACLPAVDADFTAVEKKAED
jgi:hypothetical protein